MLPVLLYFATDLTLIPHAGRAVGTKPALLCAMMLQQVSTGFFEETVSRGIVLSAFWRSFSKPRCRIAAVIASGVVFGLGHSLNFLFGGSVAGSLEQALVTGLWGMYVAALYMLSGNLPFVMALHAVWDILVRLPGWLLVLPAERTPLAASGEAVRAAIDPFLLAALAFYVCLRYDRLRRRFPG